MFEKHILLSNNSAPVLKEHSSVHLDVLHQCTQLECQSNMPMHQTHEITDESDLIIFGKF